MKATKDEDDMQWMDSLNPFMDDGGVLDNDTKGIVLVFILFYFK